MMYLIFSEVDRSLLPQDLEEAKKINMTVMEMVKKDLDSGELKMFGMSPDGRNAFVISNQDEKTILAKSMVLAPHTKLKVMPMLSFDEALDAMKAMQP